MNKKVYIVGIVLILIAGATYFTINNNSRNNLQPIQSVQPVSTNPADATPIVSALSITNTTGTASAVLAGEKTVTWQTSNYPADAGVNINLLRKVSDSPQQFAAVRAIAVNTANDGQESWALKPGETGDNLYLEVTCSTTYKFQSGCKLGGELLKVN